MGKDTSNRLLRDVLCSCPFQWMKDMWRSDPCYADYGVDGSTCSFFIYLSEVSSFLWLLGVHVCTVLYCVIAKLEF